MWIVEGSGVRPLKNYVSRVVVMVIVDIYASAAAFHRPALLPHYPLQRVHLLERARIRKSMGIQTITIYLMMLCASFLSAWLCFVCARAVSACARAILMKFLPRV